MKKEEFLEEFEINNDSFITKSVSSYYDLTDKDVIDEKINIVDGGADGGIDYFFDQDDFVIVGQSKYEVFNDKKRVFDEIRRLIDNFESIKNIRKSKKGENVKIDVVTKIQQICEESKKIKFQILFIGFEDESLNKNTKLVEEFLNSNSLSEEHKNIELIFGDKLFEALKIYSLKNKKKENNINFTLSYDGHSVPYSNNNIEVSGYLVNVNAYDMYLLIKKYNKFVFEKNIRGFLNKTSKAKKTNNNITESLEDNSSFFWFANNGIIILCENANFKSSEIELSKMSIINGAQTVSNIFYFLENENDEKNKTIRKNRLMSVFLPCKIVALKNQDPKIINYIVQSSNTQKSVKSWTLFSNHEEVIKLNQRMKALGYFLNYKDGFLEDNEYVKNLNIDDKYKVIDLDKFVQSKISIFNLTPGYATQNKEKLFFDETYVSQLNKELNEINFIMSIVKAYYFFKNEFGKLNKLWVFSFLSLLLSGDIGNVQKIKKFDLEKIKQNIKNNTNKYDSINFLLKHKKYIKNDVSNEELVFISKDVSFIELIKKFIEYCEEFRTGDYYSDNRFYFFVINNFYLFEKFIIT